MPLRIYQKRGVYGRQFVLRNGRLDILGIDTAGDLYVIELKKDSGYDDAYAQTREYIDWIEEDVAVKGQRVFGIICLNDPTKDLIEKSRLTIRCGYLSTPFPIQRLSNEEGMYPARPSDQLDNPRFLE